MGLIAELKRRSVFRMAVLYLGSSWLIMQVVDLLIDRGPLPESLGPVMLIVLSIGFPISLLLAWFYELTPGGILPDEEAAGQSGASGATGRAMDFVVIAVLAAAVLLFAFDKWWLRDAAAPAGYANSVAVLAFDDLSPDGDQGWFSDGLSEEIINSLAQLPELKVTARTSAFHFKGLDLPVPQIAATLGVAHVVEGSVRRSGDRMRVTAQLIKADDGFHLWSETYDRDTDDVFAVQEDIATSIASALDIYLDEERREEMFQTGTRNVQAYEAFLRGLGLYNKWHTTDARVSIWDAQRWFERALEYDPEFAQAHFSHGDAYFHFADGQITLPPNADAGLTSEVALDLLFQDYDRAIEFAHDEGLRVFYQAERMLISDDWSGFRPLLEQLGTVRVTSTSPIFAEWSQSYTAFVLLGRNGVESNYRHYMKVLEVNPMNRRLLLHGSRDAIFLGKHDEALELIERLHRIDSAAAAGMRLLMLVENGHYDELLADPETPPPARVMALAATGRYRDETLALIEEIFSEAGGTNVVGHRWMLFAQQLLGETKLAEELYRALDARPVYSTEYLTLILNDTCGRLIWDLEWTPNYAARLAELGVELEPFEFAPPTE